MRVLALFAACCLLPCTLPALAQESVVIRNTTIWTQSDAGLLEDADIRIEDGKIVAVGRQLSAPDDAIEIDARGKHVTPGLIDCHSHTAIRGGVNEGSNNITAEVRIADVLNPLDINLYRQLAGGVTTIHTLHGSANSIGGQDAVIKLRWGAPYHELPIEDASAGIKFALGENPKRSNSPARPGSEARYPATRMGVMESIRERFAAAQDYRRRWDRYNALSRKQQSREVPPRRDLQLDAIAEILRGERVIHSHSYRQDEILALMRLAEEFEITIGTFQHVLEGYKIADELAAHGAGASTFSDWWAYKLEAYDAIPFNGALMHERGVRVSFNSDSSELARRMNLEAAKAVKYGGVPPTEALDFVTRNAAIQLGIDHRTGSLVPGMDADLVLWSGDPLSVYSIAERTWVDGITQFELGKDREQRQRVADEREELLERLRGDAKPKKSEEPTADKETAEMPVLPSLEYQDRLAASGGSVSIIHAEIHPGDGSIIADGTVSFTDGRIVALGAGLPPLAGATLIDAEGRQLHPGFIDANTALGLTEIGSVAGSNDISELGDLHPNVNTSIAINPDSELLPVTRANGTTHALSVPSGGLLSGSSTLIRLDGWSWEDLRAASPAAMHIRWPSFGGGRSRFGGRGGNAEDAEAARKRRLKALDKLLDEARAYARARGAEGAPAVDRDPALESLQPLINSRQRVIVHADQIPQVESAIAWSEKQGVPIVIAGAGDLWRMAETLAAKEIPVIVTSVLALPRREDEPYDTAYALPAKLKEAGVTFCIASSGSRFGASMVRNLPYHAAMAVAHGLDRQEALRALTIYPARILGLEQELGSIEIGKSASMILTDGDPLEIRTHVQRAFIDGRAVELEANKHERLYRKYRSRPALTE